MNKTIWMCWFQGEEDNSLSELNRKCINRWRQLNPTWQVNVLSDKTIAEYVPEYFEIIKNSRRRQMQKKSDLLRLLLLSKFGGVWVDASVYPMMGLNEFYNKIVNETGFFAYRFIPRGGYRGTNKCETTSWFLCSNVQEHYLIENWKKLFIEKFKKMKIMRYFELHETLTDLYDTDDKVKYIIDNMIQIDEKIPHSACGKNIKKSYLYKRPNLKNLNDE